jgi:hypothetical protein
VRIRKLIEIVLLILAVHVFFVSCATKKMTYTTLFKECIGVWINQDYNAVENKATKIIYKQDGTWIAFDTELPSKTKWSGTFTVTKKWIDKEKNCWYEVTTNQIGYKIIVYELWKISNGGTILEGVWCTGKEPHELILNDPTYTVYYLQLDV